MVLIQVSRLGTFPVEPLTHTHLKSHQTVRDHSIDLRTFSGHKFPVMNLLSRTYIQPFQLKFKIRHSCWTYLNQVFVSSMTFFSIVHQQNVDILQSTLLPESQNSFEGSACSTYSLGAPSPGWQSDGSGSTGGG